MVKRFILTDRDMAKKVGKRKFTKYADGEVTLFAFLPQNGSRINSKELMVLRKKANRWHPGHPLNVISGVMRSLRKKIDENGEKFRLCKTAQSGPHPVEFWLERR